MPDRTQQTMVVVPLHLIQRAPFLHFAGAPGPAAVDQLGLVQSVDRLDQGVVVGVTDASHGWINASLGQAPGVADRNVLAARVAVVDQRVLGRSALVQCLL